MRYRYKLSFGEDILRDESVAPPQTTFCTIHRGSRTRTRDAHDRVIHKQSARLEHSEDGVEVTRLQIFPHVLHHPDGRCTVELRLALELTVAANLNAAPVRQPRSRDVLTRECRLRFAE